MPMFDDALPYYKQFITEVTTFLHQENVPSNSFLVKEKINNETEYKAYLIDLDGNNVKGGEQ